MLSLMMKFLPQLSFQNLFSALFFFACAFFYIQNITLEHALKIATDSHAKTQIELAKKEESLRTISLELEAQNHAILELKEQEIKQESRAKKEIAELKKRLNALKLPTSKDCVSELLFYKRLFNLGNDKEAQP